MPHITDEQYAQAVKAGIIKPESTWYEPKEGEEYWHLSIFTIDSHQYSNHDFDHRIIRCQQVFRTKAEAEKEDAKRIALTTIKRWCALNAPFTPDWGNGDESKWYVGYNHRLNGFMVMLDCAHNSAPTIPHLARKEHAEQLINLFDKELRIIFEIE